MLHELNFKFSVMGLTETRITSADYLTFNPNIPGYSFEYTPTPLFAGGVGIYLNHRLKYKVFEKKTSNESFQALWIELQLTKKKNVICGVIYR